MAAGCTIAAKRFGDRYFLLKNRDLVYDDFKDSVSFDEEIFAVVGMDIGSGVSSGVSLGVNRWGLSGCSSSVLITDDGPYDPLLERVLRECKTLEEACSLVSSDLERGSRYQWCNFILANPDELGVIEIGESTTECETDSSIMLRTNHHLILPTHDIMLKASLEEREACGPLDTSQTRRRVGLEMLRTANTLTDMMALLSNHSSSRQFDSICRHRSQGSFELQYLGETSYSYILEVSGLESRDFDIRIHVARGNPCSNSYREFIVDFEASLDSRQELQSTFL